MDGRVTKADLDAFNEGSAAVMTVAVELTRCQWFLGNDHIRSVDYESGGVWGGGITTASKASWITPNPTNMTGTSFNIIQAPTPLL